MFGIMGSGNMPVMDELVKMGIKKIDVRHEGVACGMADGWARATRTTGFCTTTEGPGVTQLATALVTASRANVPLVAYVGECAASDHENQQQLDQARFAAACETSFVRVESPDTVDASVRKAFYVAKVESRPVMLSAPVDIQKMSYDDDEPYKPSSTFISMGIVHPDPQGLQQAADIIATSRKPVIVVGQGAMWSGAGDAVIKLANRIGALVATSLRGKDWLFGQAEYHVGVSGQYSTRTAMQLFEEADCVIAIGASMNRYTTVQGFLYPKARFVQIDSKPHVMMGAGLTADCYIQSDARIGVEALESLLAKRSVKLAGYHTPEVKEQLVHHFEDPTEFPNEPGSVDPRQVCLKLDELVPSNIPIIAGSGGQSTGFLTLLCHRPRPYVLSGLYFGCIGQMLPAAMGAMMAKGNKPTVLVEGDASMIMHLADFDTAVRYNMPLLVVVLNNQALGSEYHQLRAKNMDVELSIIPSPDLGAVAKALGGKGALVRTIAEVQSAVAEWIAKPAPMIIDARTWRDVPTLARRRMLYGRDE